MAVAIGSHRGGVSHTGHDGCGNGIVLDTRGEPRYIFSRGCGRSPIPGVVRFAQSKLVDDAGNGLRVATIQVGSHVVIAHTDHVLHAGFVGRRTVF